MHFRFLKAGTGITVLAATCLLASTGPALAQTIDTDVLKATVAGASAGARKDTARQKIKPYKDVVPTTAKTTRGFFSIHKVDDRWLAEIPDSLLGRDMLVVNRIIKDPGGMTVSKVFGGAFSYAGTQIGQDIIRWDRLTGDKIFLRSISFGERSADSSSNGLFKNVQNNNMPPIEAAFPIKAINDSAKSVVIDLTDFINTENSVLYFYPGLDKSLFLGIAGLAADRSFIEDVRAFPMNIEISTVRTYNAVQKAGATEPPRTYELNSSILLLPATPMRGRPGDVRVGFFEDDYVDFDANPQGVKKESKIQRWRMEPKPEDRERYLRGELVEPAKPIVIYIDPLTPRKWVPYLIQGINDWQSAFEGAGFRNAIVGREAPVGDSTWSMEDARHSVLMYHPANIENASGPNVHDPRSGEILETHINWYHNVMEVLYEWYFVQAAAVDPRARRPRFDDSLMGTLIRFVSSHEVGHTLGLMHNFGASSTVPVDSLRSKAYVDAHGHTPSIMDYARFDYVAQPEDGIDENGLFPHIGDYDKWAIRWGYRWLPPVAAVTGVGTAAAAAAEAVAAVAEKDTLNAWIVRQLASGPQYFYGAQLNPLEPLNFRSSNFDPRDQNEDLGDDAMKASEYGIRNLKRIEPHLLEWTREPHADYEQVGTMYKALVAQYGRYMGHVSKNIGGVMITPKTNDQQGPVFTYPSKDKQERAMAFLNAQLFATPAWLIDERLYGLATVGFEEVGNLQVKVLDGLLDQARMDRMIDEEATLGSKAYTVTEMLHDLQSGVFGELAMGKPIDMYRRNLQKAYVNKIVSLIGTPEKSGLDMGDDEMSIIKAHARALAAAIKAASVREQASVTRDHLEDLYERLELSLKPRN
jgi:Met-zincin/Domain of unknown function (DUF5117)/Domain of unknown function (DUF5118)